MEAHSNADKVFVALPETYEDGLSTLIWVFSHFPQHKTEIIITHVTGLFDIPSPGQLDRENMELVMNMYLSVCTAYEFEAETLVHEADDIAEGIVQIIAIHEIKNLVMGSGANSNMTYLAFEIVNKVRVEANLSCKLWFIYDDNLIFTREVNSYNLTPAPTSEVRSHNETSSSISARSNNESTREENKLAENLQQKEEEIRELKETLLQLRREIEEKEIEKLLNNEIIEQLRAENDLFKSQRDECLTQIHLANERRLANEMNVELLVQQLCIQNENMHCGSSTTLNSEFSMQELQQATEDFSETLKIGEGGFGPVYKGYLRQITVAIKLLNSPSLHGMSQFQQEITILTKVRHPNLVTLIGACSEEAALVYEYLSNGSLEDRLACANNTPPLTWQARTRIISEICLALIFLHSNKPELVIHGDLKPGNILLDTNLVSKLSDFGISRLLKQPDTNLTAFYQTSRPAGTFSYIDPEYSSTGILTAKSDIYSLGIIILRLLTGKSPRNIVGQVQDAMTNGILSSVIDNTARTWPIEQAMELAKIALRCAEYSRSMRPDLVNEIWPVVEPLMKAACTCVEPQSGGSVSIPSHFICPIIQEVMQDPCIAADGFTYEGDAIKQWLNRKNTSPMTNLPLPHRNLIQNRVLRSAIQEWLQQHPQS